MQTMQKRSIALNCSTFIVNFSTHKSIKYWVIKYEPEIFLKKTTLFRIVNHGAYTFSNISSGNKNLIKALAKISNSSKDHVLNTNEFHEKEAFFFLVCMSVKYLLGYKTKSDDTEKSFRNKDRRVKQPLDLFNSMQKCQQPNHCISSIAEY